MGQLIYLVGICLSFDFLSDFTMNVPFAFNTLVFCSLHAYQVALWDTLEHVRAIIF